MELLSNNPSMQDLIQKLNEVVESLNNNLPSTNSEIAEVKELVSFGSNILASRLNAKLWYFKTQEFMKASTELCEGDSCFILNPGGNTGEGTFEYWYIYKTDDVGEILDSYIELSNPDLVGVKIQELTFKALLSKFDSIKKFSFLDLVTTATETNPGKALDAIVGKLLADRIGNLGELSTTDKGSLVGAIKEIKTVVEDNYSENTRKIDSKAERTELQTETSERKQEIAVERARINNLTQLSEGSTTGDAELQDIRVGADGKVYDTAGEAVRSQVSELKGDLAYKINSCLTPVQFETVLGYYAFNEFVSGKKEWGARLMRVPCKKGDKYLYHGYSDNIYGVSFLDSEFGIIRQIHVPKNKEFEMDVNVIDNASYIDFYSANKSKKTYVLKYNREDTSNNDVGKIFIDASSQLIETDDKYFSPLVEELVYGAGMKLKEITPENDTVFKFSFTQHQSATAYVDDFCIVTSGDYQNGTEVFYENIIVFVPKGKTLRINDFKSDVYVSKFEKLVPITDEYINDVVKASTGLPYIAVASNEAPTAIKSVCQFICDGTDDNIEIQNAINSLGSAGGKVFLTKGKFFISAPIDTGDTLVELCGEGALLDLHEDTLNSDIRGGTILQAVENTDLVHIGGAKGTTVHDIAFFGYGRNKVDNTSYGIRFTGYADTDRIYNCGFTNCAIAIGSDIATDVVYIHNLSVQRNKIGIALYKTDAEIHDCIFCENIGMESVIWDNETYDINCSDVFTNDGKIYNNTFRRSGMCYDIYKVYGNESGLESDDVKPISSVVVRQRAHIVGNTFFDCIYANCIRIMMKPDFLLIEGNSFTKWGHKDQIDDCRKSAICFDAGSVLGTIMNNRFYSDSNTEKFTDKYAIYENNTDGDNSYWRYSNTYMNNFIGNLTADTENKCRIIGTAPQNQFINNIVVNR